MHYINIKKCYLIVKGCYNVGVGLEPLSYNEKINKLTSHIMVYYMQKKAPPEFDELFKQINEEKENEKNKKNIKTELKEFIVKNRDEQLNVQKNEIPDINQFFKNIRNVNSRFDDVQPLVDDDVVLPNEFTMENNEKKTNAFSTDINFLKDNLKEQFQDITNEVLINENEQHDLIIKDNPSQNVEIHNNTLKDLNNINQTDKDFDDIFEEIPNLNNIMSSENNLFNMSNLFKNIPPNLLKESFNQMKNIDFNKLDINQMMKDLNNEKVNVKKKKKGKHKYRSKNNL